MHENMKSSLEIAYTMINPRRACASRVTVVGSVCVSVCASTHFSILCCPKNDTTY